MSFLNIFMVEHTSRFLDEKLKEVFCQIKMSSNFVYY